MQVKPQISREGMRRLCALFLLFLSVGPWLLAFSSPDAITGASLPACCRVHGKHKCLIRLTSERGKVSTSDEPAVSQISEHCPYHPIRTTTARNKPFGQPAKGVFWAGYSSVASLVAIATWPCTSFLSRANCKRGPPSPALSLKATTDRLATRQRLPFHWRHNASIKKDISSLWSDASPGLDHTASCAGNTHQCQCYGSRHRSERGSGCPHHNYRDPSCNEPESHRPNRRSRTLQTALSSCWRISNQRTG